MGGASRQGLCRRREEVDAIFRKLLDVTSDLNLREFIGMWLVG